MDESVEVVDDVGMQVVDDVDGEYACGLFEAFHMAEGVAP